MRELELHTERELQVAFTLAGAAAALRQDFSEGGGVRRVQADVGGAAATAVAAPVRMVPHVVSFGAELEAQVLVHRECLEQAHVPVLESRLIDQVADALRVERARRRRRENRRAVRIRRREPLSGRTERADDFRISVDHPELPVAAATPVGVLSHSRVIHVGRDHATWNACLEL